MIDELSKVDKYQSFRNTYHLPSMHVLEVPWVYTRKMYHITGEVVAYELPETMHRLNHCTSMISRLL
jgi:hypothetical protein